MSFKARDRILSSIDLALGFPPKDEAVFVPQNLTSSPRWLDPMEPREDLRNELEALSTRFHRAENLQQAQAVIVSILKEHSVRKAVRWDHPLLDALGTDELLQEAGAQISLLSPQEGDLFEKTAQADLGITAVDAVLVNSGTLVLRAQTGRDRSTSLLPPVHLAVVTPQQRLQSIRDLVPLLREWLAREGRLPSSVSLISGPSRTADIELNLVLGAHGPKVLHVLEVDPAWIPEPRSRSSSA